MDNQRTCGKGLAENSSLPAKLGELTASLAENLEVHMTALDLEDRNSKREYGAYALLAQELRKISNQLSETARQMAGYRDLLMGRHDHNAMSAPEVRNVFEKFVSLEQELLALLQNRLEQDRMMLVQMNGVRT